MIKSIKNIIEEINKNDKIKCIILTGNGKAFCAGVDLKSSQDIFKDDFVTGPEFDLVNLFRKTSIPIIAAINGPCITGGFELALACDILICSEEAFFQDTHSKWGILFYKKKGLCLLGESHKNFLD
jgi:enoyl-CoA hydratase